MQPRALLIAQIDPPHCGREGDWYYRTFLPGRALAEQPSIFVVNLDNVHRRRIEIMRRADVLILNSVVDPDLLPILRRRREQRLLTVYEISDDVSAVPPWNPVHYFFGQRENLHLFLRLAATCDANQYSVEELRRLYGHLTRRGEVFPNQLDHAPARRERNSREDALVVGWGGSRGHLEDIARVAEPLSAWIMKTAGARLHLMAAQEIWRLFDALPESKKRITRPGPLSTYYEYLRGIDIGIAPLCDTGFNRSRSDVKFVEYAAHGVVPVVQALVPYIASVRHEENGFLFRTTEELIATLDRLARDPDLRERVSHRAREQVCQERIQARHVGARLEFYLGLLGEIGHRASPERATREIFQALSGIEGAELTGRHLLLGHTRFEKLLHSGLVLSQQERRPRDAIRLFQEAAALEPENYQPHMCMTTTGESVMESLLAALQRNGESIQGLIALGMQHVRRGEIACGMQRLLSAAELFPAYEVPYLCCASVLRSLGDHAGADEFTRSAEDLLRTLYPPADLSEAAAARAAPACSPGNDPLQG